MDLHILYARKEPTLDLLPPSPAAAMSKTKLDVVFYHDQECTRRFCIWSWHLSPPRKNTRRVMLNCYHWSLRWLQDVSVN